MEREEEEERKNQWMMAGRIFGGADFRAPFSEVMSICIMLFISRPSIMNFWVFSS